MRGTFCLNSISHPMLESLSRRSISLLREYHFFFQSPGNEPIPNGNSEIGKAIVNEYDLIISIR